MVENRPGAGTNIGMAAVARAVPDGTKLGLASITANAINRWLYDALTFDPERDFAAVGLIGLVPNLMVVAPGLPVRDVAGFIVHTKAYPGEINYASAGAGSAQHLAGAPFAGVTGILMQHVPDHDAGPLNTDLIDGWGQVLFRSISAIAKLVRAGRMRPLAVTGTERQPSSPEMPTLRERGVDMVSTGWFGLVMPAGVPGPVLDRLGRDLTATLQKPELQARMLPGRGAEAAAAGGMRARDDGRIGVLAAAGARVDEASGGLHPTRSPGITRSWACSSMVRADRS